MVCFEFCASCSPYIIDVMQLLIQSVSKYKRVCQSETMGLHWMSFLLAAGEYRKLKDTKMNIPRNDVHRHL